MPTVFLYTFFVGFGLTVISALLGAVDAGLDHGHGGDLSHGGGGDLSHHGHSHGDVSTVSPINFQTIVAFLMGFGGVGYVALGLGSMGYLVAIPLAVAGGLGTGTLIFKWLRFLVRGERPLGPTEHVGVVGRLTVGIRQGGTGEMVYTLHGTRMVTGARSADGTAVPRGTEVVVLRYAKGIAYVQPLREPVGEEHR